MNQPDQLRASAAAVAAQARWVRCDEARLEAYVEEAMGRATQPRFDPTLSDVGDAPTRLAFVLMRDATNFGSGYHPVLRKAPGLSGARTTGLALAEHFRKQGPRTPEWCARATARDCAVIFNQDDTGPAGELMSLFAAAWNQLGNHLIEHYSGSFFSLLEDAAGSALRFTQLISQIPFFQDAVWYQGRSLPFLKRAQLAAYDVSLALAGEPFCDFQDLERLTIFADNLVPHVLKLDRVLVFDADLDARIESGQLLTSGSDEEIEIRALAVYVTERLSALCRERGDPVMALQLSDWLWHRGQMPLYKQRPRHRCRCVYY
jgi:hypothetical protein